MAAQGHDIKLSAQRVEGYRNFATKLWNAARFAEINSCKARRRISIRRRARANAQSMDHSKRRANAVGIINCGDRRIQIQRSGQLQVYRFVWDKYCDWYVELAKPLLTGADGPDKDETRATAAWMRDQIFKLLHPFMPFITEELWKVTETREQLLTLTDWPHAFARSSKILRAMVPRTRRQKSYG